MAAFKLHAKRVGAKEGEWRGADRGTMLAVGLLLVLGQTVMVFTSCALLALPPNELEGLPTRLAGRMLAESALLLGFFAALALPVVASGLATRSRAPSLACLARYPLRRRDLALLSMGTMARSAWFKLALVLAVMSLVPLAFLPQAGAALTGSFLFVTASFAWGWALLLGVTAVGGTSRARRWALGLLTGFSLLALLPAFWPLTLTANGLELRSKWFDLLLVARNGSDGLLLDILRHSPAAAVTSLGLKGLAWQPLLTLALVLMAGLAVAALAFRSALRREPGSAGAARSRWPRLPFLRDPLRALVEKELRHHWCTLDASLGLVLGALCALALLMSPRPPALILALLPFALLSESPLVLNSFGLDRAGVTRYRLAPLQGGDVLLSKSLAFVLTAAVQCAPAIAVLTTRSGLRAGASLAFALAGLTLALCAWGLVSSTRSPAPREFWNFDSKEQSGGLSAMVAAMLGASLLGAVAWQCAIWDASDGSSWRLPLVMGAAFVAAVLTWRALLPRAAAEWVFRAHELRERLSA